MSPLAPASTRAPVWRPRAFQAGPWRVSALSDGCMRLDGGAMWGVVPAPLWRPLTPPDEHNAIPLALRPFLAECGVWKVLIEPGIGSRWSAKERTRYALEAAHTTQTALAALGLEPAEITHVVATHCHWDHIGAQVVERADGELAPAFPRARHYAPAVEVECALRPDHVRRASYRAADVEPLIAAGLLEGYAGERELLPGLVVHELGGHSDGVSLVTLGEPGGAPRAVFWSDVVPTAHHVQPPYIMAYDIDVARSYAVRSHWLARAADEGICGLFYHDLDHAFARLERTGTRYTALPLAGEAR